MFVRKKRHRSGSISIQVISKEEGRYRVIRTIGCSRDPEEIDRMVLQAQSIIENPQGQLKLFSLKSKDALAIENFVKSLSNAQVRTLGPELIFGTLFDRIGFNEIKDDLFRHITIARLAYPASKLKTVDYLRRYLGLRIDKHAVYRFLDILQSEYKDRVERISFEHTKTILKTISVVFYDMTSLYFESEDEDDLRKIGFSKDGKFQQPQIMLGLLVGLGGYPIGYDIFQGNTFEGHTLIPVLEKIQKKYGFDRPTVIADSALLSKKNLENLEKAQYFFIVGGRIKNESDKLKDEILKHSHAMKDADAFSIQKEDGTRLIVHYSQVRAHKDTHNRERGIKKLRQKIKSGKLTKDHINEHGYNKFLTLQGELSVSIDEKKVLEDARWDGLKGYITNTDFSTQTIVENYSELWQIEKAFRISKTDLRIRPIFHYRKKRIEAHILISFVAYTIYKELERLLIEYKINLSPQRASELTHNIYELEYILPGEALPTRCLLKMDTEQQLLYDLIHKSSRVPH